MGPTDVIEEALASENFNQQDASVNVNELNLSVESSAGEESFGSMSALVNQQSNEDNPDGSEDSAMQKRALFSFKKPESVLRIEIVNSTILDPSVL